MVEIEVQSSHDNCAHHATFDPLLTLLDSFISCLVLFWQMHHHTPLVARVLIRHGVSMPSTELDNHITLITLIIVKSKYSCLLRSWGRSLNELARMMHVELDGLRACLTVLRKQNCHESTISDVLRGRVHCYRLLLGPVNDHLVVDIVLTRELTEQLPDYLRTLHQ